MQHLIFKRRKKRVIVQIVKDLTVCGAEHEAYFIFHMYIMRILTTQKVTYWFSARLYASSFAPTGPSGTNIIIGSVAGAILLAAIILGGTGWGFK